MALNDLTPQLRTRLGRLERVVGWFVSVATLLLLFGLGYYVYDVAQRKGWFLQKVYYYTYARSATGLKIGEPRFVIYSWGQSLKPAPNSIVTSGANVGLCVNYQITGEFATRSVVRVDFDKVIDPNDPRYGQSDVTRPHIVVEQFNVLPPE